MQARHLQPVLQDRREPVAASQPQRRKPGGDPGNFAVPGRVGEPPPAIDDRQRVGRALDRREEGAA